jgi:hypothetical protein
MSITLSVSGLQEAQDAIMQELKKFRGGKTATVGIHEEAGNVEDGDLTMAGLGAMLHFGAEINHPGGTSYGYANKKAAEQGKVRFLGRGKGYMSLGTTGAHKVTIPPRPWLDTGVASGTRDIIDTIADQVEGGATLDETLEAVGVVASGAARQYMTELKTPPNAPSTIKEKGSDNPLINRGHLRAAVTHAVTAEKLEEGL